MSTSHESTSRQVVDEEGQVYEEYSEEEDEDDGQQEDPTPTTSGSAGKGKGTAPAPGATSKSGSSMPGSVKTPIATDPRPPAAKKNPFETPYVWNRDTSKYLTVTMPRMSSSSETTNDLTRNKSPENRYWRTTAEFAYEGYKSPTIRIENVLLGYSESRNYGEGYVYAALPMWFRDIVLDACKASRPTIADDPNLQSNVEQWWKTINFKTGAVGRMVKRGNGTGWAPTPLDTVFKGTSKAVTATVVVRVHLKVMTSDKKPLSATDIGKISLDADRIYLTALMVDAPAAPRIARSRAVVAEPPAFKKDVESESLAKQLNALGL